METITGAKRIIILVHGDGSVLVLVDTSVVVEIKEVTELSCIIATGTNEIRLNKAVDE